MKTLAKPKTEATPTPPQKLAIWQDREKAMKTPIILTPGMAMSKPSTIHKDRTLNDQDNLFVRLHFIKEYRNWAIKSSMPQHAIDEDTLKLWLVRGGYDHKLSSVVFSGQPKAPVSQPKPDPNEGLPS